MCRPRTMTVSKFREATAYCTLRPDSARHARERILKISPDWPWKDAFLTCWPRLCARPAPA